MPRTENPDIPKQGFILGDTVYNVGKFIALILLPALNTLIFALSSAWNWDNVTPVIGTIAAIDTFLGLILGISTVSYNASDAKYDGTVNVMTSDAGNKLFTLELDGDPEELEDKKDIVFKVRNDQLPEG